MRIAIFLAAGTLAGLGGRAGAQAPADVHLPLQPYFRDLRVVRLAAGDDTLSMLLDTGGGTTLVVPEVAARHACAPYGKQVGHRMSGEAVVFQQCESLTIGAAGWSRRLAPIGVFDVNALLPATLPRLDGVLALDAFAGEVISIDLPGDRLVIHRARVDAAAGGALPFRPATGMSGGELVVMVPVAARRGPLWFLLDSGNLTGTRLASWVAQDSVLPFSAAGEVEIRIGTDLVAHTPYSAADLAIDGALGTDFFRRGPIVLDLRRLVNR